MHQSVSVKISPFRYKASLWLKKVDQVPTSADANEFFISVDVSFGISFVSLNFAPKLSPVLAYEVCCVAMRYFHDTIKYVFTPMYHATSPALLSVVPAQHPAQHVGSR